MWENLLIYAQRNGRKVDVQPNTRSVAFEIADAMEDLGHKITRIIGAGPNYQHNNLLCLDLVGDRDFQDATVAYLLEHHERLQVEYFINQSRMWRAYAKKNLKDNRGKSYGDFAANTFSPYGPQKPVKAGEGPRFIGTDNDHDDHLHLTLYPGLYVAPPAPPKPFPQPQPNGPTVVLKNLRPGLNNADVVQLQKALIRNGQKIPSGATGFYGDQTKAAVVGFQKAQGWSGSNADGIPGPATAARLGLTLKG